MAIICDSWLADRSFATRAGVERCCSARGRVDHGGQALTWNLSAAGSVASCVTLVEGDCTTWDAAALHGDILSLRSDRDAEVLGRGVACHGARDGLGLVAGSASYNCDGGQGRPVLASRRLDGNVN